MGKTTTAVNTAAALASSGARVAAIDLDPQAHMTIHLGIEPQAIEAGAYKVLTQSARFEEQLMLVRPNLWLLPANIDLVGAESELVSVVGREIILREALQSSTEEFDYCLIDCAPSLGLLTLNALAAAREVLIPLQPHFLALQGFGKLLQTIDLVNKRINPDLKVKGVLLCMFDTRASLPNEVRADIEQFLENARGTDSAWAQARIIPTYIRRNIKLAEAPSYGKTIFEYEPDCNGARDYWKVAQCVQADYQPPPELEVAEMIAADETSDESDSEEHQPPQPESAYVGEMQEQADPTEPSPPQSQYVDIYDIQDEPEPERHDANAPPEQTRQPGHDEIQVPPPAPPEPEPEDPHQQDAEPFESSDSQSKPPIEIRESGGTTSSWPSRIDTPSS